MGNPLNSKEILKTAMLLRAGIYVVTFGIALCFALSVWINTLWEGGADPDVQLCMKAVKFIAQN